MGHDELRILRKTRRPSAGAAAANRRLRMAHEAAVSVKRGTEPNQSGIVVRLAGERIDRCVQAAVYAGHLSKDRDRFAPKCSLSVGLPDGIARPFVPICVYRLVRVKHRRCEKADSINVRWAGS